MVFGLNSSDAALVFRYQLLMWNFANLESIAAGMFQCFDHQLISIGVVHDPNVFDMRVFREKICGKSAPEAKVFAFVPSIQSIGHFQSKPKPKNCATAHSSNICSNKLKQKEFGFIISIN